MIRYWAIIVGLGVGIPAHATDGLQWQWEGQERTYEVLGDVRVPTVVWFRSRDNIEVRVTRLHFEFVMKCAPMHPLGKKAWQVGCQLTDVSLQAVAPRSNPGDLLKVLTEWDERLTGKTVAFQHMLDGRVRSIGFIDVVRQHKRDGQNIEVMRQVVSRGLAALDMRLPKGGDDNGDGTWVQKGPMAMGFMSSQGSVGGAQVVHTIRASKGGMSKIISEGSGTMADASSMQETAGSQSLSDYFDMEMAGDAIWSTTHGHLVRRAYQVAGSPTASSNLGDGFAGIRYEQAVSVRLIGEGMEAPTLSETKAVVLTPSASPAPPVEGE